MTKFKGTKGNNVADATGFGVLIGFTPHKIAALLDSVGDVFNGLGGGDSVSAGEGNDTINGGAGNDALFGNGGKDKINGGAGNDNIEGGNGNDILKGGAGNDFINGGDGDDTIDAGARAVNQFGYGFEIVVGGDGSDTFNVAAPSGKSTILAYVFDEGAGGVTVNLAAGNAIDTFGNTDTLNGVRFVLGTDTNDSLTGSNGDDTLAPGRGVDTVDGGQGTDILAFYTIQVDPSNVDMKTDGFGFMTGITVIHTGDNAGIVTSTEGVNTTFSNMEIIAGTRFADIMTGSAFNDWLIGGEDDDTLDGGAGTHDIVDYSLDVVGGGQSGVTVNLTTGFATDGFGDTDTLSGFEDVIGTRFADTFIGDGNANTFTGGLGKDTMTGGAAADIFVFNSKLESAKGANRDVILDFSGINGGEFDKIDLSGIDAKKGGADNAFTYIGAKAFHHKAGELQVKYNAATDTAIVSGDIDGNGKADFQIEVHSLTALQKLDFAL